MDRYLPLRQGRSKLEGAVGRVPRPAENPADRPGAGPGRAPTRPRLPGSGPQGPPGRRRSHVSTRRSLPPRVPARSRRRVSVFCWNRPCVHEAGPPGHEERRRLCQVVSSEQNNNVEITAVPPADAGSASPVRRAPNGPRGTVPRRARAGTRDRRNGTRGSHRHSPHGASTQARKEILRLRGLGRRGPARRVRPSIRILPFPGLRAAQRTKESRLAHSLRRLPRTRLRRRRWGRSFHELPWTRHARGAEHTLSHRERMAAWTFAPSPALQPVPLPIG